MNKGAPLPQPPPPRHLGRFMANLVVTQYIEQGPALLAKLIQLIPSFNL